MTYAPFLTPNRSKSQRQGRAKGSGGNYYTIPGVSTNTAGGSKVLVNNQDEYSLWYASSPMVIDQLACEVTTGDAGQNMRMGFYAADADWQPVGPPLADSGSISLNTTGVKTYTPGTAIFVPTGWYLSVINTTSNVTAFLRFASAGQGSFATTLSSSPSASRFQASRAYAAFPTPGQAWTVSASTGSTTEVHVHMVFYRVTAA